MVVVLEIAAACVVGYIIYVAGTIALATILRIPYDEVGLFYGPRLLRVRWHGVDWRVNLFPIGSYVRFARPAFDAVPMYKFALLALAGCVSLFATATLCVGPARALQMLLRGFEQVVAGGLRPRTYGAELVRSIMAFVRDNPFLATLGAVAAKCAAMNLLPLPNLAGGMVIVRCLQRLGLSERAVIGLSLLGVVVTLALAASWLVAVAYAIG